MQLQGSAQVAWWDLMTRSPFPPFNRERVDTMVGHQQRLVAGDRSSRKALKK